MPSATPPAHLHDATSTNPSHYTPATSHPGATATHSRERHRFHQFEPTAIYDTASDPRYHAHTPTERPLSPSSLDSAQQEFLSLPSSMSRHSTWAYPNHLQWHSSSSPADAHTTTVATSTQRIAHQVWLLECKHCRTFLTNRGMKVRLNRWSCSTSLIHKRHSPGCPAAPSACSTLLHRCTPYQLFSLFCKARFFFTSAAG
jgi:hypothetical protein